jgi:hypothetical protein
MTKRKREDDAPIFKGLDDEGEPVFVWTPDVPAWLRKEYVNEWKRTHPASPEKESKP